jgi:hypothetical protein
MTISITDSKFITRRRVTAKAGSSLPEITIRGRHISEEEIGFEERDASTKKTVGRSKAQAFAGSRKTYSFPPARAGCEIK